MDFRYLDCYLVLEEDILPKILGLNQILVDDYGSSIFFSQQKVPHITLFMGFFPFRNIDLIYSEVTKIAQNFASACLNASEISVTAEGYVFLNIKVDSSLRKLHESIVAGLNPLREGLVRDKFENNLNGFSSEEKKNVENYGFPWVMNLFKPHVTIGKLPKQHIGNPLPEDFLFESEQFTVKKIAIGHVGDNGTVIDKGKMFSLGC